jgi:hypothetical protein
VAACGDKNAAIIIDPIALAAVVLLTLIMVFGVKESFWFNVATVVISVVAILLCIFMGESDPHPFSIRREGGGCALLQTEHLLWHRMGSEAGGAGREREVAH